VPDGELATAISGLEGSRFVELGRTLNMVEVGFVRGEEEIRLHVQCPFRVVRDGLGLHRLPVPVGSRPAADTARHDHIH
jgi:hypothetical protein